MLAARLEVGFTQTFDAGALVLWGDPTLWAKLALEFSPQREAIVVSVVTRGSSDDASAASPAARHAWLRIARLGGAFAFHVSADGTSWRFVRHFTLGGSREIHVGFGAQSPLGDGCTARFSDIAYVEGSLPDLRNGD